MSDHRFKAAYAECPDWRDAVAQCVRDLAIRRPPGGLGFLYTTDLLATELDAILARLRQETGIPHWVGTVGDGICVNGREVYDRPAMAVMVADLAADSYRILPTIKQSAAEALADERAWREQSGCSFGIVHGDPTNPAVPELIGELAAELSSGFLVGGLSSSKQRYPQIAGEVTEGGLSGVLLGADVPVVTGLTQGCSLLGGKHVITESQRNIVIAIDGRPALDVFKEEIGELLARDLSRVAGYVFVALPIPESDTGDYLVRNLIGIDPGNGLLAIGEWVKPGDRIQFARRDARTARDDMLRMLEKLKARAGNTVRGAVYFTCLGRGRHLFGPDSAELRLIQQALGDVPVVGFYANGEISHNRLYGYTGVLTLFL